MSIDLVRDFLGWCALINIGIFAVWVIIFFAAHDWLYSLHGNWFNISVENFDHIHYMLMGFYKISILLLFLIPYLSLRIVN